MKKIIFIGQTGSGKTTLTQAINNRSKIYKKTQAIEYYDNFLDTPGEYLENRRFYNALISSSFDCDMIGFVMDCTQYESVFPPNFASIFNKPVIGIITKIDCENKNIEVAKECLYNAGVSEIFMVSSINDIGIEELKKYLL